VTQQQQQPERYVSAHAGLGEPEAMLLLRACVVRVRTTASPHQLSAHSRRRNTRSCSSSGGSTLTAQQQRAALVKHLVQLTRQQWLTRRAKVAAVPPSQTRARTSPSCSAA
jgi:hypothetical protein